jgi:hypothetical protein
LLLIGGALIVIHATQRDHDGYYISSSFRLAAPGYAITSEQLDLAGGGTSTLAKDAAQLSGSLRIRAISADRMPIFVGIARQTDADRYLYGVARKEVVDGAGAHSRTVTRPGHAPVGTPADQHIWHANVRVGLKTKLIPWIGLASLATALLVAGAAGLHTATSHKRA